MNGAIPTLPLYAFMSSTGTISVALLNKYYIRYTERSYSRLIRMKYEPYDFACVCTNNISLYLITHTNKCTIY